MKKQESAILKNKLNKNLLTGTELKSSIPKPLPTLRSNVSVRAKSASSCKSQPTHSSKIPLPFNRSPERGKTSFSLKNFEISPNTTPSWKPKSVKVPETHFHVCNATFASPVVNTSLRPKSASVYKNPYSNIQAKVNSKPPEIRKRETSATNIHSFDHNGKYSCDESRMHSAHLEGSKDENADIPPHEDILEKKRQLLTIYNELKKTMPSKDIQPLEVEISRLMQVKPASKPSSPTREKSFSHSEATPEFLNVYEKQTEEMTRMWLQLICDLVTVKLSLSNSALSRLTLPDPSLNVYEEVVKFLSSIPVEGEPLHKKLQMIEREQQKVMSGVMHNGLNLSQEYENLKDAHSRLEKTQDKITDDLENKVAFLIKQNQELTTKHEKVVDKYNVERAKAEQQEKYKYTINKDVNEAKKIIKCFEGKCQEWDAKIKKMEAACRTLEVALRNRNLAFDKESKQNRDILNKLNESKNIIQDLRNELAESNQNQLGLEMEYKRLKEELLSSKASSDELRIKRNELMEELSVKNKKLADAENELSLLQAYGVGGCAGAQKNPDISSRVIMEDVSKDLDQRDLQIQQLKKELNRTEHSLKEKTAREEFLLKQANELQNQPREIEVAFKTQIEELQLTLKDLASEKVELEKMVAQKTLELDQRDLLDTQHLRVLQARDLIPLIREKQTTEQECIEKLRTVIFEQQTTYLNKGDDGFTSNTVPYLEMDSPGFLDPFQVDRELAFRQEKMSELYGLLENKQIEMMRLERRMRQLEGAQNHRELNARDKEGRISALHREITNQQKSAKSRGFFSMLSGQDG